MKFLQMTVVILFILILFVPILFLNTTPNVASAIDNRMLAENPFSEEVRSREDADLTLDIENYLDDRIGFRDEMLLADTVLNDRLFGKMIHPSYAYGKNGYVFFNYSAPKQFGDYHIAFADMVLSMQNYCRERGVPFLFVFNPEKTSVYREFVAEGVKYNDDWVDLFLQELDKRGIHYIDNTPLLTEKKEEGESVFNRQYNAGHWNDLGAFYGVNNILQDLQQFFPGIRLNEKEDFDVQYVLNESLQVSRFPIHEEEPVFTRKAEIQDLTPLYQEETKVNPRYAHFEYSVNPAKKQAGSPKTLIFQGSYMNGMGYKFLENSLGEYIAVHDYQNVLNFPYYFNLYQPECVIFEVAEYTFESAYFDYEGMKNICWNPPLSTCSADQIPTEPEMLNAEDLSVEQGRKFTVIRWNADRIYEHVWLTADGEFDMALTDAENMIYEVTIPRQNCRSLSITAKYADTFSVFQASGLTAS